MLAYLKNGASVALDFDDYYIQEEWFGADDTLAFTLPASHPQLPDMMCQLSLVDKESGQAFLITNVDEGDVKAKIDLDEFREQMFLSYTNGSATAMATAQQVLPSGWSVQDFSGSTARRTIEAEGATALEILQKLPDTYGIAVRFDRKTKRVLLRNPDTMAPSGTYLTEELNLRKRPVRSQTSEGFATRLYAVGKDGVTFASINGGKNYVENHEYSDRVISAYWKDERYTDPQSLLDDAKKKLSDMAKPAQSYECDVADLAKIDPARFGHLSMEMYQAVTLLDAERGTRLAHRVVQYKRYPHYPEKNVVTLSTLPGTISGKVEQSYQAVTNQNSSFQQQLAANLQGVAQTIVGAKGGSVKFIQDEKGKPTGILFMDTEDEATAKNILRINHMGLAFSNNGSSGPWTQAITIDGGLANQWIETWQLTASIIVAGILQSRDGKSFWNLDSGELKLNGSFESSQGNSKFIFENGLLQLSESDDFIFKVFNGTGTGIIHLKSPKNGCLSEVSGKRYAIFDKTDTDDWQRVLSVDYNFESKDANISLLGKDLSQEGKSKSIALGWSTLESGHYPCLFINGHSVIHKEYSGDVVCYAADLPALKRISGNEVEFVYSSELKRYVLSAKQKTTFAENQIREPFKLEERSPLYERPQNFD